jgi:hypothetical protein
MIITLGEAKKINPTLEQEDLDAFEQSVRALTNNNFQNRHVRFKNVELVEPNIIKVNGTIRGLREGDTLEVNYSHYNDGLHVIDEILSDSLKVQNEPFLTEETSGIMVTKVEYPADIKQGIKKLIEYDKKMAKKIGIKSETISRMSTTYYDVNANDNVDGYPAALVSFLDKHEKMRWG